MAIARHHAEWLSLVEVSGPFLSMPVLLRVFPQGLDAHDPEISRALRLAIEEWQDNQQGLRPDPAIHTAWVRFVLRDVLGFSDALVATGPAIPEAIRATIAEHGETLRPSMVIRRDDGPPRILVQVVPPAQDLDQPLRDHRWKASPATRMAELLRAAGVRIGLVTNGERWMLVHAQLGETAGFISWYAGLWLDEPITLRAFRSLLSTERTFGVSDAETLAALLTESASNQQEVTEQLGDQVREAVEVLVQTLDRIDKDQGRALLAGVEETRLYEAALTVMMRLVFLFSAEERELLMLGKQLYDEYYAVSTLRAQLREAADQAGEEVLERRFDAWSRLLATFRAVFGGVQHEDLRLPAYGGELFDPDRFPFLEGRTQGSGWTRDPARPLPVDNRTVLHLLEALQILRISTPGGGPAEPRRLSFRALDIEQIGHVYEGLLDHTARRAAEPVLGLVGKKGLEPEVPLAALEQRAGVKPSAPKAATLDMFGETPATPALQTTSEIISFLEEETGRSASALRNALAATIEARDLDAVRAACDNDAALFERVRPFAGLLRRDTFGRPVVITAGSVYVTSGTDRRTTGTHYTPRSLTEPIVQHTLDPLVYHGPAEGLPKEQWALHPAERILSLQVCDMAMGSGAFLVQACRYLAERVAEASDGRTPGGSPDEQLNELFAVADPEERLAKARRLVADRCLYGVDKNPLAVEMAKLSLWLVTLQKDRPFSFLDHALRCGDSLLGVAQVEQVLRWSLAPGGGVRTGLLTEPIRRALQRALALRNQIRATPVIQPRDAEEKARLLHEAEAALGVVKLAADLLVAAQLHPKPQRRSELSDEFQARIVVAAQAFDEVRRGGASREALATLRREADELLAGRRPFHWPLEFPEVFIEEAQQEAAELQVMLEGFGEERAPATTIDLSSSFGFSAIVGNPPFQGGKLISGALGTSYRDYLVSMIASGVRGHADLCAYFFLRSADMLLLNGCMGLIATNTISQGDTREVGLDRISSQGFQIYRAIPTLQWPGLAAVQIAKVWLVRGNWSGDRVLNNAITHDIDTLLTSSGLENGRPLRLQCNATICFNGSYVLGMGFVLSPTEALSFINSDRRNSNVLFPFLNGEDLNSDPSQSPSRYVINFHDWPVEEAQEYTEVFSVVESKVKPERTRKDSNGDYILRKPLPQKWWLYADKRPALYAAITKMRRVLVVAATSRTLAFSFSDTNKVFSHATYVFALDKGAFFALLQSATHEKWAREYASSMKGDLRYTPSDVFETFPFPASLDDLDAIGESYHEYRRQLMLARQEGLTKTYNRFHSSDETSADIAELRRLHVAMDQAVASAYGWGDLDLGHGFHETKQGLRYTISEPARRTVLDRLLALNHQRYAEEVAQGLHDKGAKKAAGKGAGKPGRPKKGGAGQDGEQGQLI